MTLELPDVSLSAAVELDIDTDNDAAKVARRQKLIEIYAPRIIRYPVGITVPVGATGAFQFVTDSPADGRRLHIRRFHLDIAQPLGTTRPTGVTVYLVADPGNNAVNPTQYLHSAGVIKVYTSLPIDDTWPLNTAVVYHPENVWIFATQASGTAVNLAGNLQTTDMPVDMYSEPTMVYHILDTFGERD